MNAIMGGVTAKALLMVPIQVNGLDDYGVWVFLGWEDVLINANYTEHPNVISTEYDTSSQQYKNFQIMYGANLPVPEVEYCGAAYKIYQPVCAELNVKKLLDRQEFQAVCDEYKSAEAIIAKIGAIV